MSGSASLGAVGAAYWSYMASELSDHLKGVVKRRATDPKSLLEGVQLSAGELFVLLRAVTEKSASAQSETNQAVYRLATSILSESSFFGAKSHLQVDIFIRRSSLLLPRLERAQSLTDEEVKDAQALQSFFAKLAQKGEEESYVEAVGGSFEP